MRRESNKNLGHKRSGALNAQPGCDSHIDVNRESQYRFVASALGSLKKAGFWNVGFENNNN